MQDKSSTTKPMLASRFLTEGEPAIVDLVKEIEKLHGAAVVIQDDKGRMIPVRINMSSFSLEAYIGNEWKAANITGGSDSSSATNILGQLITTPLTCGSSLIVNGVVILKNISASKLVATNAANELVSTDASSWITGTTNQVTVTDDSDGSVTLSLPQSIDTASDVTFDSATLNDLTASKLVASDANKKLVSADANSFISGTTNQVTVTDDTDGTVTLSLPQNIHTGATPQFAGASIGDVGGGNYIEVEADGTLEFKGNATVWDDIRVPVTSTKLGGSRDPGFTVFKTNGAGSQGVFIYWFDASIEEEIYFTVQMPHSWKEGTDILPHVHWIPSTTPDNTPTQQRVSWGLEYAWANIGDVFPTNTTVITNNTIYPTDTELVQYKHYLTQLSDIVGTGKTISSMLVCRLFRNATSVAYDTYEHDAGLLEIDFHFEQDTIGSRSVTTK